MTASITLQATRGDLDGERVIIGGERYVIVPVGVWELVGDGEQVGDRWWFGDYSLDRQFRAIPVVNWRGAA